VLVDRGDHSTIGPGSNRYLVTQGSIPSPVRARASPAEIRIKPSANVTSYGFIRRGLLAVRAGLLHPCGLCIPSDRTGGTRNRRNGSGQAEGREGGKDQVFHIQVS
jgi:hypothetical protein